MQLFEKLIEYPEAVRLVLENTHRLPAEDVPLVEAQGLALAKDLEARFDSPPFDNSAVDGYALRSADAEAGRVFSVVDEAPAGRPAKWSVGEGEAIKIFTGGVIPEGADAVVMVENTSGWGEEFELKKVPHRGGPRGRRRRPPPLRRFGRRGYPSCGDRGGIGDGRRGRNERWSLGG